MWPDKTLRESLTSDAKDLCFGKVISARKDRPGFCSTVVANEIGNIHFGHRFPFLGVM